MPDIVSGYKLDYNREVRRLIVTVFDCMTFACNVAIVIGVAALLCIIIRDCWGIEVQRRAGNSSYQRAVVLRDLFYRTATKTETTCGGGSTAPVTMTHFEPSTEWKSVIAEEEPAVRKLTKDLISYDGYIIIAFTSPIIAGLLVFGIGFGNTYLKQEVCYRFVHVYEPASEDVFAAYLRGEYDDISPDATNRRYYEEHRRVVIGSIMAAITRRGLVMCNWCLNRARAVTG